MHIASQVPGNPCLYGVCTALTRFSGAGAKYDHILGIFSDSGGVPGFSGFRGGIIPKGGYLIFPGGSDPIGHYVHNTTPIEY